MKPAAETVAFALDGRDMEIDLSEKHAKALRKAMEHWIQSARRVGGRRGPVRRQVATDVDTRAVRAWAESNGVQVASRGRIPLRIVEQYRAAGN